MTNPLRDIQETVVIQRFRIALGLGLVLVLLLPLACAEHGTTPPKNTWSVGVAPEILAEAAAYAGGSGMILRGGAILSQWGDVDRLHDLQSATKSIGVMALGLAVDDGLIRMDDKIADYCPGIIPPSLENSGSGWVDQVTFLHLATHTAGFGKPGGHAPMLLEPGTAWAYSDGATNHLADCLTVVFGRDLKELLFERVFTPIGINPSDLKWRDNQYREPAIAGVARRELGSGIHSNVRAMAAIGRLFLNAGMWEGKQIIAKEFMDRVRKPIAAVASLPVKNDGLSEFEDASKQYGLLWWNNGIGTMPAVPEDAFWAWGLRDNLILVIPSLDLVAVRAGESIEDDRSQGLFGILEPFFTLVTRAVNHGAPYPNSRVIANLVWKDPSDIIRMGAGSDTWPTTWADDGFLYTAYADGWGFEPLLKDKLSMGFAKIDGVPPNIEGINIRSDGERFGNGPAGEKASGMLMVDGVLYMWVRNADNDGNHSQLAWSLDRGKTWEWSDWVFEAFGYSTFINYGKNYGGARDRFVYVVSHDHPSAYHPSDRFILMRVPKERLRDREAYEFFVGSDASGTPLWTADIGRRGAVFEHRGNCFRSGITYNEAVGRYFWWQSKFPKDADRSIPLFSKPTADPRFAGAFGVFDAPEPWGPWTTVFYTENWDVGPGETGSFPAKWMSEDGITMHLVFSGDDHFSVRKATLAISPDAQ